MARRFRVVITDFITDDLAPERQVLGELADLVALDATSEDDLVGHVEDAAALMLYHNIAITRRTIDQLRRWLRQRRPRVRPVPRHCRRQCPRLRHRGSRG